LVRPHPPPVFKQVIAVRLLENAQDESCERGGSSPVRRPIPGYLKVYEMRLAVVAEQNVLSLFEIDIGDAASMNVIQQSKQAGEKFVAGFVLLTERSSCDVLVDQSGRPVVAQKGRYTFSGAHGLIKAPLVSREKVANPCHRNEPQRGFSPDFEDNLFVAVGVKSCRSEEIVFEGSYVAIVAISDLDGGWKISTLSEGA